MNQPEHEFASGIVRHLDYGVSQLDAGTRERLYAARNAALARYREQPVPVAALAWAGPVLSRLGEQRWTSARHLAAISTLVLALVGVAYWQSNAPFNELAELDSGLLTDELPINAYLDKGFDSWLKRSPR
jgi:hypothetical protein